MKLTRTRSFLLCLTLAPAALGACDMEAPVEEDSPAGYDTDDISATEQAAYVLRSALWGKNARIPVCWEAMPTGEASERAWVRDAIRETWQRWGRVEFTGWGRCYSSARGIHIRVDDSNPRTTGLGKKLDGRRPGMYMNFTFETWSESCADSEAARRSCIEAIAVHEFGHALGFSHEQNRPDTPDTCTSAPQGTDGDQTYGAWDVNSVMNYCNPVWNNDGELSSTDRQAMRRYYGDPRDLSAEGSYFASRAFTTLVWHRGLFTTPDVNIFRNNRKVATTKNDGDHRYSTTSTSAANFFVCPSTVSSYSTSRCSRVETATYPTGGSTGGGGGGGGGGFGGF